MYMRFSFDSTGDISITCRFFKRKEIHIAGCIIIKVIMNSKNELLGNDKCPSVLIDLTVFCTKITDFLSQGCVKETCMDVNCVDILT